MVYNNTDINRECCITFYKFEERGKKKERIEKLLNYSEIGMPLFFLLSYFFSSTLSDSTLRNASSREHAGDEKSE